MMDELFNEVNNLLVKYNLTLNQFVSLLTPSNNNKYKEEAKQILDFLNAKTGRNYRPVDANLSLIIARLKSGATIDNCRGVIAKKCRDWLDDEKMNPFLRPATLFARTNFEQYLGELPISEANHD